MYFNSIFIWILLINKSYSLTSIYISPNSQVVQGVKVNISCYSNRPTSLIKWSHNGKEVGEDNMSYNKDLFEIEVDGNRYDLIIKHATLRHRGKWSCKQIADDAKEVNLNVSVPWTLKAIATKKVFNEKVNMLLKTNNSYDTIETGQKAFPYNLLSNHSLEVICQSECGLPPPKYISVRFSNTTSDGELRLGNQSLLSCKHNKDLYMLVHTVVINCFLNGLRSRNEIMCQSQGVDGNILSNKPIFIVCPAHKIVNELTKGERVAIAISMVLAVFDVIVIVLLLKRNCQHGNTLSQSKAEIIRCPEVML